MNTPQRIEKPVRLNLTQRLHAAHAKVVENPTFHGEKISGWWLITPVGNFKLRRRGGSETDAAALEMLDLPGYQAEVKRAAKGENWLCLATKQVVPELTTIQGIKRDLDALAKSLHGEYDGWEAKVEK